MGVRVPVIGNFYSSRCNVCQPRFQQVETSYVDHPMYYVPSVINFQLFRFETFVSLSRKTYYADIFVDI